MKTTLLPSLLASALFLTTASAPAAPPADPRPKLAIVVVEILQQQHGAFTDFDRLDLAFQQVARERHWPVVIAAERFAANTAEHETELRIFNRPLREEARNDLTFRGWMTLTVQGVKHDLGIVTYVSYPRPGQSTDEVLERVFLGAANAAADRIEPLLFPKAGAAPKP